MTSNMPLPIQPNEPPTRQRHNRRKKAFGTKPRSSYDRVKAKVVKTGSLAVAGKGRGRSRSSRGSGRSRGRSAGGRSSSSGIPKDICVEESIARPTQGDDDDDDDDGGSAKKTDEEMNLSTGLSALTAPAIAKGRSTAALARTAMDPAANASLEEESRNGDGSIDGKKYSSFSRMEKPVAEDTKKSGGITMNTVRNTSKSGRAVAAMHNDRGCTLNTATNKANDGDVDTATNDANGGVIARDATNSISRGTVNAIHAATTSHWRSGLKSAKKRLTYELQVEEEDTEQVIGHDGTRGRSSKRSRKLGPARSNEKRRAENKSGSTRGAETKATAARGDEGHGIGLRESGDGAILSSSTGIHSTNDATISHAKAELATMMSTSKPNRAKPSQRARSFLASQDNSSLRVRKSRSSGIRGGIHTSKKLLSQQQLLTLAANRGGTVVQYLATYHSGEDSIPDENFGGKDALMFLLRPGDLIVRQDCANDSGTFWIAKCGFRRWKLPGRRSVSNRPMLVDEVDDLERNCGTEDAASSLQRPILVLDTALASYDAELVRGFTKEAQAGQTPDEFFPEGELPLQYEEDGNEEKNKLQNGEKDAEFGIDDGLSFSTSEDKDEEQRRKVLGDRSNTADTNRRGIPLGDLRTSSILQKTSTTKTLPLVGNQLPRTKSARQKKRNSSDQPVTILSMGSSLPPPVTESSKKIKIPGATTVEFFVPVSHQKHFGLIEGIDGGEEEIERKGILPHRGRLMEIPGSVMPGKWHARVLNNKTKDDNVVSAVEAEELCSLRISLRHHSMVTTPLEKYHTDEVATPKGHVVSRINTCINRISSFIKQGIFTDDEIDTCLEKYGKDERVANDSSLVLGCIGLVTFDGFTSSSESTNMAQEISETMLTRCSEPQSRVGRKGVYHHHHELCKIGGSNGNENEAVAGVLFPCKLGFDSEYSLFVMQDEEFQVTAIDVVFRKQKDPMQCPSLEDGHVAELTEVMLKENKKNAVSSDLGVIDNEVMRRFISDQRPLYDLPTGHIARKASGDNAPTLKTDRLNFSRHKKNKDDDMIEAEQQPNNASIDSELDTIGKNHMEAEREPNVQREPADDNGSKAELEHNNDDQEIDAASESNSGQERNEIASDEVLEKGGEEAICQFSPGKETGKVVDEAEPDMDDDQMVGKECQLKHFTQEPTPNDDRVYPAVEEKEDSRRVDNTKLLTNYSIVQAMIADNEVVPNGMEGGEDSRSQVSTSVPSEANDPSNKCNVSASLGERMSDDSNESDVGSKENKEGFEEEKEDKGGSTTNQGIWPRKENAEEKAHNEEMQHGINGLIVNDTIQDFISFAYSSNESVAVSADNNEPTIADQSEVFQQAERSTEDESSQANDKDALLVTCQVQEASFKTTKVVANNSIEANHVKKDIAVQSEMEVVAETRNGDSKDSHPAAHSHVDTSHTRPDTRKDEKKKLCDQHLLTSRDIPNKNNDDESTARKHGENVCSDRNRLESSGKGIMFEDDVIDDTISAFLPRGHSGRREINAGSTILHAGTIKFTQKPAVHHRVVQKAPMSEPSLRNKKKHSLKMSSRRASSTSLHACTIRSPLKTDTTVHNCSALSKRESETAFGTNQRPAVYHKIKQKASMSEPPLRNKKKHSRKSIRRATISSTLNRANELALSTSADKRKRSLPKKRVAVVDFFDDSDSIFGSEIISRKKPKKEALDVDLIGDTESLFGCKILSYSKTLSSRKARLPGKQSDKKLTLQLTGFESKRDRYQGQRNTASSARSSKRGECWRDRIEPSICQISFQDSRTKAPCNYSVHANTSKAVEYQQYQSITDAPIPKVDHAEESCNHKSRVTPDGEASVYANISESAKSQRIADVKNKSLITQTGSVKETFNRKSEETRVIENSASASDSTSKRVKPRSFGSASRNTFNIQISTAEDTCNRKVGASINTSKNAEQIPDSRSSPAIAHVHDDDETCDQSNPKPSVCVEDQMVAEVPACEDGASANISKKSESRTFGSSPKDPKKVATIQAGNCKLSTFVEAPNSFESGRNNATINQAVNSKEIRNPEIDPKASVKDQGIAEASKVTTDFQVGEVDGVNHRTLVEPADSCLQMSHSDELSGQGDGYVGKQAEGDSNLDSMDDHIPIDDQSVHSTTYEPHSNNYNETQVEKRPNNQTDKGFSNTDAPSVNVIMGNTNDAADDTHSDNQSILSDGFVSCSFGSYNGGHAENESTISRTSAVQFHDALFGLGSPEISQSPLQLPTAMHETPTGKSQPFHDYYFGQGSSIKNDTDCDVGSVSQPFHSVYFELEDEGSAVEPEQEMSSLIDSPRDQSFHDYPFGQESILEIEGVNAVESACQPFHGVYYGLDDDEEESDLQSEQEMASLIEPPCEQSFHDYNFGQENYLAEDKDESEKSINKRIPRRILQSRPLLVMVIVAGMLAQSVHA